MNYDNFNWGTSNDWFKQTMVEEIFQNRVYEFLNKVEDGDVVVDIGSSIGPFIYSLKETKVKEAYCLEPSQYQFETLVSNCKLVPFPVTCLQLGIGKETGNGIVQMWGREESETSGHISVEEARIISFSDFLKNMKIEKIDFLKTDCEGGEYDIFNIENFSWIHKNVKKIAGEWHLNSPESKARFKKFRDIYLNSFDNYKVYSVDGVDITWSLFTQDFLDYYTEVIVYIDNQK